TFIRGGNEYPIVGGTHDSGRSPFMTVRQDANRTPVRSRKAELVAIFVRRTGPIALLSEVRTNGYTGHHPARHPGRRARASAVASQHLQRPRGRPEPVPERVRPD